MSAIELSPSDASEPSLVSVVIIFLNEERFLPEAVASVYAQTYPRWELLLVDDGSTDGSVQTALAYAAADPDRVRYLSHPGHENRGMSASRNLGLEAARGAYVSFLDADDALEPAALAEQAGLLEAHPAVSMVYGPALWWRSWTGRPDDQDSDQVQSIGVAPDRETDGTALLTMFLQAEGAHPTGPLYRRSALEAVGGFEARFRGMYEDQALRAKLCLRFPAYVSSQRWYRYRQHPESCCAQAVQGGRHRAARAAFLRWLSSYLSAQGIASPVLRRAVRRSVWDNRRLWALEAAQAAKRRVGRKLLVAGGRRPVSAGSPGGVA